MVGPLCSPARTTGRPAPTRDGLNAIPDAWIPHGRCRGDVDSPYGSDTFVGTRTDQRLLLDLTSHLSPDVYLTAVDANRVALRVDMPFPIPDIKATGPMHRNANDVVHFEEQHGKGRSADIWHMSDGRTAIALHQPGEDDITLFVRVTG
jgi:hypothetical protein